MALPCESRNNVIIIYNIMFYCLNQCYRRNKYTTIEAAMGIFNELYIVFTCAMRSAVLFEYDICFLSANTCRSPPPTTPLL